jgi:tRNA(His) guanylyltransferase
VRTMSTTSTLGERMKAHEHTYRAHMPRRTYTLIRLDGRGFSNYTRRLTKPFDDQFADDMDTAAISVCKDITGTVLAYVQSDEISILIQDFARPTTEPWMGGVTAKMLSLTAARATATFNRHRPLPADAPDDAAPVFDSRIFALRDPGEVINYFLWRQRDAIKNSISMAASAHFSHRTLDRLNTSQRQALLTDAGVDWHDYAPGHRHGRLITSVPVPGTATFTRDGTEHTIDVTRHVWQAAPAPLFSHDPDGCLPQHIPSIPDGSTV